jgi:hypothetical protein
MWRFLLWRLLLKGNTNQELSSGFKTKPTSMAPTTRRFTSNDNNTPQSCGGSWIIDFKFWREGSEV